jgi:hypothetical protein
MKKPYRENDTVDDRSRSRYEMGQREYHKILEEGRTVDWMEARVHRPQRSAQPSGTASVGSQQARYLLSTSQKYRRHDGSAQRWSSSLSHLGQSTRYSAQAVDIEEPGWANCVTFRPNAPCSLLCDGLNVIVAHAGTCSTGVGPPRMSVGELQIKG